MEVALDEPVSSDIQLAGQMAAIVHIPWVVWSTTPDSPPGELSSPLAPG